MSVTLEHIADCAVDTGSLSIFNTDRTRLPRSQQRLAHLASGHVSGTYQAMLRETNNRPATVCLIHSDHVDCCLGRLPDNEALEMKMIGTMDVNGSLLISDPAYVYEDMQVEPLFPRYLLCLWGRDEDAAEAWLDRNEVPFEHGPDGIHVHSNERPRLDLILRRLRLELRQADSNFKLVDWIKDSANLYDQIQLRHQSRILSYRREGGGRIFEGIVTSTGYGDGYYPLQAFKHGGQTVGYRLAFIRETDSDLDESENSEDDDQH